MNCQSRKRRTHKIPSALVKHSSLALKYIPYSPLLSLATEKFWCNNLSLEETTLETLLPVCTCNPSGCASVLRLVFWKNCTAVHSGIVHESKVNLHF